MLLKKVETRAFRNLADQQVELAPHTTVLFGPNGQGKTNFLEACYLLSTLRPLRAQKLVELVRSGEEAARVSGQFQFPGGPREVEIDLRPGGRSARLDGKSVRDPDELFGGLATVSFTPDDLAVVKAGPEGRRKLLDRAVQNRHPDHFADARDYLRALRSRNHLLRERETGEVLASFDEPVARLGERLRARRIEVLEELRPHAARAFAEVARGEAELRLEYAPAAAEWPLAEALQRRLARDLERGYTSAGPHADDLAISLGDKSARAYASQGQARAAVLAFKIGEIENLRGKQGRAPLLLLDDVSSELDPERNAFLMSYLAQLRGQVVLTTTDPRLLSKSAAAQARFHSVSKGWIAAADPP
ncbi:MAG: DNA replication/repair protein RecF [Deltaproteobacteria bacterium]|nr:MAG: DNA replication/repair protein RecF [Deltaproteobacteria bacterium]